MFWEKVFEKQRTKRCFGKKSLKKRLFCDVSFLKPLKKCVGSMVPFPNIPCRPSEWASNFENTLADPLNGHQISKTSLTDPLNGRLILKAALADPPNGRLISKTSLTDPLNGRLISKTTLTDPPNGQLFRKIPLQTDRRQVFHEKQRKIFRLFGSASSPHGMQQKAGCRETRSTAAYLYINE